MNDAFFYTVPFVLFLASGLPHLAVAEPFRNVEHWRVRGQILLIDDQREREDQAVPCQSIQDLRHGHGLICLSTGFDSL